MDTRKSINIVETIKMLQKKEGKVNCSNIEQLIKTYNLNKTYNQVKTRNEKRPSTSEVHEETFFEEMFFEESMLLDLRTFICANGMCQLQHKRSHHRISAYNWKKMLKNETYLSNITMLAQKLMTTKTSQESNELVKSKTGINKTNIQQTKMNCVYCNNPKLEGREHTHFVKEEQGKMTSKALEVPIENVFTKIDKKAEKNTEDILSRRCPNPPSNKISKNNKHRMSYGDINYIGNNRALLYFDRGLKGTQTFINSMQPISKQLKSKDIIVLDDIVFTSTCKCDSNRQHLDMFPHYRVTCAVGLTCPSRLNNFEKETYKRKRNASTEMYTKASSMLIRYWR